MTDAPLFTPRFYLMCGYSFLVFFSAFQLLPTAPFHILALGGTPVAAGLFLGGLTYASALTAPVTGALADRLGKRRILVVASLAIAIVSATYAVLPDYRWMLAVVVVHGVFWSGLLSASASYVTDFMPISRRAEGMSFWGLATVTAVATAPTVGLWVFERGGWPLVCAEAVVLNLAMLAVAWRLPPEFTPPTGDWRSLAGGRLVEWPIVRLSLTLFLYTFGYGGITSFVALYAESYGAGPRALYFAVFSSSIVVTRPYIARLGDRIGHARVLGPCLIAVVVGYVLLAISGSRPMLIASAIAFGTGFGSAYPLFVAHVLRHVDDRRRGAAFGGMLAMFDTGIGTGSIAIGWVISHFGYRAGYGLAALVAACAAPYFLAMEPRVLGPRPGAQA